MMKCKSNLLQNKKNMGLANKWPMAQEKDKKDKKKKKGEKHYALSLNSMYFLTFSSILKTLFTPILILNNV